jgi:hypothetical protein
MMKIEGRIERIRPSPFQLKDILNGFPPPLKMHENNLPVEGLNLDHVWVNLILEVLELLDLLLDLVYVRAQRTHLGELALSLLEELEKIL